MKLSEADDIIADYHGYLVSFEHIKGSMLHSDHFPDVRKGECPFESEEEATAKGMAFAKATVGKTCNFRLVRSDNFTPVGTWKLENR